MESDPVYAAFERDVNRFKLARADAISYYSDLEQALCDCFAYFSGTKQRVAGTIFFKITAARARRDILDELKKQKLGVRYTGFWDSIMKAAAALDDERNRVVHWAAAFYLFHRESDGNVRPARPILKKPNFFANEADTPEVTKDDLEAFTRRCEVLKGAFEGLLTALRTEADDPIGQTWREICQRPLDDPLPPDHPLYRKPTEP